MKKEIKLGKISPSTNMNLIMMSGLLFDFSNETIEISFSKNGFHKERIFITFEHAISIGFINPNVFSQVIKIK